MVHPQVVDEELQMWRVTANILNRQSQTADKRWSSSLEVARAANNSALEKKIQQVTKYDTGPQTWMNSLEHPKQWEIVK
jgi:hypothetical protein